MCSGVAGLNETEECRRLRLTARLIETDLDVEILRQIRNACREGFSFDNSEISPEQQAKWWASMRDRFKGWLYYDSGGVYVGYGALRCAEDDLWYSSVAVLPEQAGRGYGGAITADVIRRVDFEVWATARLDNPAAMRLHRAVDWDEIARDNRLAHYVTKAHVYSETYKEWSAEGWART